MNIRPSRFLSFDREVRRNLEIASPDFSINKSINVLTCRDLKFGNWEKDVGKTQHLIISGYQLSSLKLEG